MEIKNLNSFLFKLYKYLFEHKNVVCTSINTVAFYSMYLKNFKLIFNIKARGKNKSMVNLSEIDQKIQKKLEIILKENIQVCKNKLSKQRDLK